MRVPTRGIRRPDDGVDGDGQAEHQRHHSRELLRFPHAAGHGGHHTGGRQHKGDVRDTRQDSQHPSASPGHPVDYWLFRTPPIAEPATPHGHHQAELTHPPH